MDFYLCRLFKWIMVEKNVEKKTATTIRFWWRKYKYEWKEKDTQNSREWKSRRTHNLKHSSSSIDRKNTAIKIIVQRIFFMVEYICKALIWSWLSAKSTELSPQNIWLHMWVTESNRWFVCEFIFLLSLIPFHSLSPSQLQVYNEY